MEKTISNKSLSGWVSKLESHEVYAPAVVDGIWGYHLVEDAQEIRFDHPNTIQSPKTFVFPQREVLFEFEQEKGEAPVLNQTIPDPSPFAVFGVRSCDAKAMTLTDTVFTKEFDDPYYWARRDKGVFIGLACNTPPSHNCFCRSIGGSPHGEDGLDIQMTELPDSFYVKALTGKGKELIKAGGSLFKAAAGKDKKALKKIHADADKHELRPITDLENKPAKLKISFESPLWDEKSKACIECGICTFLCPTCHCFDMNDEVASTSPLKGQRVRTWDTCQFPDFTMHSSGHNPRPGKASRLRQRVCHKFQYFFDNHGVHQCTGCGRCVSECPVGIDIVTVVNSVTDNAQ